MAQGANEYNFRRELNDSQAILKRISRHLHALAEHVFQKF